MLDGARDTPTRLTAAVLIAAIGVLAVVIGLRVTRMTSDRARGLDSRSTAALPLSSTAWTLPAQAMLGESHGLIITVPQAAQVAEALIPVREAAAARQDVPMLRVATSRSGHRLVYGTTRIDLGVDGTPVGPSRPMRS